MAFFGRFVTRGVQKHRKLFFRKNPSGLITVGRISSASPQLERGGKGQGTRAAPGRPGPTQPCPPGAARAAPGGSKGRAGQRQTAKASENKSSAPLRLKMSHKTQVANPLSPTGSWGCRSLGSCTCICIITGFRMVCRKPSDCASNTSKSLDLWTQFSTACLLAR
jgi:hypothetical protein